MLRKLLLFSLFFSIYFGMFCGMPTVYAEKKNKEYYVKAAFLLNFTKFVEWPSQALSDTSTITICILGKDTFGDALKTIEDKVVKKNKLIIKKVSRVEDIGECNILFISKSERKNLSEILIKTKDLSMLTVADMKKFCQSGGMVNLVTVKKKVRMEINVNAAKRAGLKISSKLLSLSKIIRE